MTASQGDPTQAREALHQLCVLYRTPICTFLRFTECDQHRAEDLASGFIEHLLEENCLEGFARRANKFRSFLIDCLKRFVIDQWRKETAAKRGGGKEALDYDDLEIGRFVEIEKAVDFDFAKDVHSEAIRRLASEKYAEGKKKERFEVLRRFIWATDPNIRYGEVGEPLQMTSNHVSKAVFDLRQDYYDYFRKVVAETVLPKLIDEETRYLFTLLAESGMASQL